MTTELFLDASARRVLDLMANSGYPPIEALPIVEARVAARLGFIAMQAPKFDVHSVRDLPMPGPGGDIALRLYRPSEAAVLPALIYFHGGGFAIGDLELYDSFCRRLAVSAGCAIVSVDYRLGPEHRFPAAADDAIAATNWIASHAKELGLDPLRLAIGGDSAGGNLAAVSALAYRDSGAPALKHQLLICPLTDWSTDTDSYQRCRHGYFLSEELMQYFGGHYLNSADDLADWRCSPLLAARHDALPSATILVGGFDPLRDGGERYAQKLQSAGVDAQLIEYPGQFHDFQLIDGLIPEAIEATGQLARALTRALSK
jgi:acetyl esterase